MKSDILHIYVITVLVYVQKNKNNKIALTFICSFS